MENAIRKVLAEQVDPILAEHYGGAELVAFENSIAKVKLTGACCSCPSAQDTLEDVVKCAVMDNVPGVSDVVLVTGVSEELLDMARKILRKEMSL